MRKIKKLKNSLAILALLILTFGCKKTDPEDNFQDEIQSKTEMSNDVKLDTLSQEVKKDSIVEAEKVAKIDKHKISEGTEYIYWPIKVSDSLTKKFYKTYSKSEIYTIAALNRIDSDHIKRRDTIIVPKEIKANFLDYAPFPHEMNSLNSIPKIIIFSYPIQAYAVYENGSLIKWGPTNMGKKSAQTPRGLFFTNWKGRKVKSTSNDEWILNWNFNISNLGGVGFHQYALPGYPASHSCLRLLDADAQFLYNWAEQWVLEDKNTVKVKGTPVIVYGDYTFGKKGIWNDLVKDSKITNISESQMNAIIEPHIPEILKQQEIRKTYNDSKNTEVNSVKNDSISKASNAENSN